MAGLHLIVGGSRSGKSAHAERFGESFPGPRVYVATCVPADDEMLSRVANHRKRRDPRDWSTLEEPIALAHTMTALDARVVLVECISLWVSNLLFSSDDGASRIDEATLAKRAEDVAVAAKGRQGEVIVVTSEVGLGIVPDSPISRLYRDLLGVCNQVLASHADAVTLVSCGIPLSLRKGLPNDSLDQHD